MKKRIISFVLAVLTVISITAMSVMASDLTSAGYLSDVLVVTLPALGANTKLCSLTKAYPEKEYSKMAVFTNSSTINSMEAWVETTSGKMMSDKTRFYPDNEAHPIYYNVDDGLTFAQGAKIVFWGEQNNIASKQAKVRAYSY